MIGVMAPRSVLFSCIQTGSCMSHERHIPRAHWVTPGKLLAGEYPSNREHASSLAKPKALIGAGVTPFQCLTKAVEPLEPFPLSRYVVT
jgi:hypothetical protein